jgi:hypothetical protein
VNPLGRSAFSIPLRIRYPSNAEIEQKDFEKSSSHQCSRASHHHNSLVYVQVCRADSRGSHPSLEGEFQYILFPTCVNIIFCWILC